MQNTRLVYATTETCSRLFVSTRDDPHDSCGRIDAGAEAKVGHFTKLDVYKMLQVVDIESGETLKRDEAGELLVRGPMITIGYPNDAAATAKAFTDGDWYRTGARRFNSYCSFI